MAAGWWCCPRNGGLATNRFVSDDLQADYSRKAAFTSLQDMMTRLRGMQFKDRIASEPADFVLTFGVAAGN